VQLVVPAVPITGPSQRVAAILKPVPKKPKAKKPKKPKAQADATEEQAKPAAKKK
jgi:hypothetical protein